MIYTLKVEVVRDALYDLNEFIGLRDGTLKSTTIPDKEIQNLARQTLAARHKRVTMPQVKPINVYLLCQIMLILLYTYRF